MKKILIYAGTTEGRTLAEIFARNGRDCDVCVATDYGKMVMCESEHICVKKGRLDIEKMKALYRKNAYEAVIDATHPFAAVVTENIIESLKDFDIPYYRVTRSLEDKSFGNQEFDSIADCVEALKKTTGNIFLTTGSKDLHSFCEVPELKERLIVRVLPGKESIDICYAQGLEGKQIIAMQGPFSKEMNMALMKQYRVSYLVTKNSGKTGGYDEKIQAANELAIPCFVIKKPKVNVEKEYSVEEICEIFSLSQPVTGLDITLAGIGLGNEETITREVKDAIDKADYIFGAKRMIDSFSPKVEKYPYYLAKDILPCLEEIKTQSMGEKKVVILFSGDTGFYSGCEKLYDLLKDKKDITVRILPGISSLSGISSRTGISWQDAYILSTHGIDQKKWEQKLLESVEQNKKTFLLTSGSKDVKRIADVLKQKMVEIHLGYQLSYEEEYMKAYTPEELLNDDSIGTEKEGLFVLLIVSLGEKGKVITPGVGDEQFIRDKVPMTKEEVRVLSICKLGLTKDSVVYDIGSGTGSIAVEIARLSGGIQVYALETNETAVSLIEKNCEKFQVKNVEVLHKHAPEGLKELPKATHAFIGGSKGNLKDILRTLQEINPTMRVTLNAISLETVTEMQNVLKELSICNLDISCVSVSKSREVGNYHLMQGQNPVYIYSFDFKE